MNTDIAVLRELDELVEAARLLGVTQAKRGFGCHTDEDSRFERAMYESIDKHRAALLAERDALAAEVERVRGELREQRQRDEARMLAAALREVHELAGWYADDEADAEDESPDDMVAHVNGLIRQICAKAIRAVKEQA